MTNRSADPVAPRRNTPYCELHVHIEGTVEPEMIVALAAAQQITLPSGSAATLRARYRFTDLQSFLDLYYDNMQVLNREEDFTAITAAYLARAHAAGVAHAELFVDPQAHTARGIPEATVLRGIARAIDQAQADGGPTAGIIVCVLRDRPVEHAHAMLDAVAATEVPVLGIGLDSAEVGYPPERFRDVFDRAGQLGWHRVAHAGEEGPPEYIWQALDMLGAERIDHGVRCLEDAALVRRLAADQIPLTVCPLSNVRLRVFPTLAAVPLRALLDANLAVTINSDDPAYFGGYIDDNFRSIQEEFGFTVDEIDRLKHNSVRAAFLSTEQRAALLAK